MATMAGAGLDQSQVPLPGKAPTWVEGPEHLAHVAPLFQVDQQGAGLEVEQPKGGAIRIRCLCCRQQAAGSIGLTCYAIFFSTLLLLMFIPFTEFVVLYLCIIPKMTFSFTVIFP